MKERSREMGSSRRTAEEIFRDYSGRRTDAVHDLTNETEVEQGFVHFDQLGLPPTFDPLPISSLTYVVLLHRSRQEGPCVVFWVGISDFKGERGCASFQSGQASICKSRPR
ncbi:uncharacterized protein LOC103964689 isoform X2 [Pyrus x bretschneideri]|uniref:uncharacterized protein LOC103964689 isoform X2 n=1 Tax=Pyrus x bretschneideri TaxID=225117 RepID=UPI0020306745|nr:uncharacterized protein LOC103964689 isoform X2 [Pyrus x bretschneideri]